MSRRATFARLSPRVSEDVGEEPRSFERYARVMVALRAPALFLLIAGAAAIGCSRTPTDVAPRPPSADAQPLSLATSGHTHAHDGAAPKVLPPAVADVPDAGEATGAAAPWPAALAKPTMPVAGPIKVTGYPIDVRTCLPDPAEHAGFTKDGEELGYCMKGMSTRCELVDRAGTTRKMSSAGADGPSGDPKKEREIAAFVKSSGLPALKRGDCVLTPPPLEGTWPYSDITVSVLHVDGTFKKDVPRSEASLVSQPLVRIGGALAGEPPVYPLTYSAPHRKLTYPPSAPAPGELIYNTADLNALVLSADGTELGVVTHSNCMEWCDDFQVARVPATRFASLVYNDAGYRAYQKGLLDRAAELFTKAAFVDATRELPAYNLACTYARKADPRAAAALDLAIARGGESVKVRAIKDKDFDAVRAAAWFVKATSHAN